MVTIRDMTSLIKLEKVQQQHAILKLVNTTVSHEMLTPLNCIMTFATSIAEQATSRDMMDKANKIFSTATLLKL